MPDVELSTAGMKVKYAVETTAGTRPTADYTMLHGVKSIPAIGSEVNALDSTPLDKRWRTYVEGLHDAGGAINLTVNDYETFRTDWAALVTAYEALTGGKRLWIEIAYPPESDLDSFYFPASPASLGFGGADVDSVLENTPSLLPHGDCLFAAASTVTPPGP